MKIIYLLRILVNLFVVILINIEKQTLNVNTEMQETENNFDLIKNKAKEILDRYSKIIKNKNF